MEKREQHTNFPNRQSARKSAAIPALLPEYGGNAQKSPSFFEELFCGLRMLSCKTTVSDSRRAGNRYMPTSF
ncbi:hypothetical protein D7X33_14290 [Butyricicoccus sp. 1XD8-22]|nr:hypothetical protein D7X33_14290 [Butyricicoccus sp. 1XD8-22]